MRRREYIVLFFVFMVMYVRVARPMIKKNMWEYAPRMFNEFMLFNFIMLHIFWFNVDRIDKFRND